jgi:hypothetical protein
MMSPNGGLMQEIQAWDAVAQSLPGHYFTGAGAKQCLLSPSG